MKQIFTLIFCVFFMSAPALANEDLQKAQDYLQSLKTLQAGFTQSFTDFDNTETILTGTFSLKRPGRMRFEFNEIEDFIVADGFLVYFYDSQERGQTNAPIGQTLADFILRDDITFDTEEVSVQDIKKSNGYTSITLVQTADPAAGSLQLTFSQIPYRLHKWRVVDAQGIVVDTKFDNLKTDIL